MARRSLLSLLLVLSVQLLLGQSDLLVNANTAYQEKDLATAKQLLDQAVKDPAFNKTSEAWVLRGFVYKDLYKADPTAAGADLLRDEALASLYMAMETDEAKQYTQNISLGYDYLTKTIFNDAARSLNQMDHDGAIRLYAKYKEMCLRMDPKSAFDARDIEFENALGTVYTKLFNQDRKDTTWYAKAVATYLRVLQRDPDNYGANYNLASLYYNRGVYNIQQISAENDIPSLREMQEVSREFFSLALPYMTKAHNMNPSRKETVLGLEGIHYSLQDVEKSEHYRHLYETLEQDGAPEQPRK
ncbi:MAG TPA: hypothetical protein VGE21_14700 [Flavobacteriales bacterium]